MRSALTSFRKQIASEMKGLTLDCGTGEGVYLPYLKGRVIILDIDEGALKKLEGCRVVGDIGCLPFRTEAFDSVWACAIIEHTRENTILELRRVTKIGGQIAVLTPNKYSLIHLLLRAWGHPGWWGDEGHERLYSYTDLKRYGKLQGEVWRFPFIDRIVRRIPALGHTIMLLMGNNHHN